MFTLKIIIRSVCVLLLSGTTLSSQAFEFEPWSEEL